jgi:hypothetical protein
MSVNRRVANFMTFINQNSPYCARLNGVISQGSNQGFAIILGHKIQQQTNGAGWAFARWFSLFKLCG